jgi:uncharacterized membrane protein YfcA
MNELLWLTLLIFAAALLYSSVGHAGASGYLAAMALCGVTVAAMKPSALVLNVLVATIGTVRFARAGLFSWQLFWPFAVLSIPCAYIGGRQQLPVAAYKIILGLVLLFAGWRMAFPGIQSKSGAVTREMHRPLAIVFGAVLGLLSGLTGVGGGIFLSPLLLWLGWADVKRTAGVSVVFILVNSVAGLLGHIQSLKDIPAQIPWWAGAALVGGWIGSELGSRRLAPMTMRRLLAVVLLIAGVKLLLQR